MPEFRLADAGIEAVVSTRFAAILCCDVLVEGERRPVLRPSGPATAERADAAACFPLVPFCNRIAGNRFAFEDRTYRVEPNTADRCRLHGDGWLTDWAVAAATARSLGLTLDVAASAASPYAYVARQSVTLDDGAMTVELTVTNRGERLPFGLGLHPYFSLSADTLLLAPAESYWLEGPGYLPTEQAPLPTELDFATARPLPARWINNGFDGWSGIAEIRSPANGCGVRLSASRIFRHYQLFQPDRCFDPAWTGDWFAFEPMSHATGAHSLADLGGLAALDPGETLAGAIRFEPFG